MNGKDLNDKDTSSYSQLEDVLEAIEGDEFLKSLPKCLSSPIGKRYLYRFLQETMCDEIVLFLQSLSKFKAQTTDKGRFMIAKSINNNCIRSSATFCINLSYETRGKVKLIYVY